MTNDEKQFQRKERNDAICAYYAAGHKLSECAGRFKLGRQRTLQILQRGGVWNPYERSRRVNHLGVTVTSDVKATLKERADARGVSVSQLTSDIIDAALAGEKI